MAGEMPTDDVAAKLAALQVWRDPSKTKDLVEANKAALAKTPKRDRGPRVRMGTKPTVAISKQEASAAFSMIRQGAYHVRTLKRGITQAVQQQRAEGKSKEEKQQQNRSDKAQSQADRRKEDEDTVRSLRVSNMKLRELMKGTKERCETLANEADSAKKILDTMDRWDPNGDSAYDTWRSLENQYEELLDSYEEMETTLASQSSELAEAMARVDRPRRALPKASTSAEPADAMNLDAR
jgi:chromosome segregation ATPase